MCELVTVSSLYLPQTWVKILNKGMRCHKWSCFCSHSTPTLLCFLILALVLNFILEVWDTIHKSSVYWPILHLLGRSHAYMHRVTAGWYPAVALFKNSRYSDSGPASMGEDRRGVTGRSEELLDQPFALRKYIPVPSLIHAQLFLALWIGSKNS